jgi:putative spermidine/putrescine transport system permease protein
VALQSTVDRESVGRSLAAFFYRHRGGRLALFLAPTATWMIVIYLGALVILLLTAFWTVDPLTGFTVHTWSLDNFHTMAQDPTFRRIALRTMGMAALVTMTDIVLAFPLAYYAARIASSRVRAALVISVVLPLWSSYLVKAFAWQTILEGNGPAQALLKVVGIHVSLAFTKWAVWITFSYLWLPFVALPIFASLERIPGSYLEASGDLGAKGWTTFRRVVVPLALPGIVAGSIFSFSLTLGDYIAPTLVGNTKFIGNVIKDYSGVANNLPFAAAYALVPIFIMAVYLIAARAFGAFEAL